MRRNPEQRCEAEINYRKVNKTTQEVTISCNNCPNVDSISWISARSRSVARNSAKTHASVVIEEGCVKFQNLKEEGGKAIPTRALHPKLP